MKEVASLRALYTEKAQTHKATIVVFSLMVVAGLVSMFIPSIDQLLELSFGQLLFIGGITALSSSFKAKRALKQEMEILESIEQAVFEQR